MRRRLLLAALCGCIGTGGCSDGPLADGRDSPARTPVTEQEPSDTSPTSSSAVSPETVLPEPGGGWTLIETGHVAPVPLDAEGSREGRYRSPNEIAFRVIVVEVANEDSARYTARRWRCDIGWRVALSYLTFAIAASTGTVQETFTPERPPKMTRTPLADTLSPAVKLLGRSPVLSQDFIEANAIRACTDADTES